jgi:hypothetical protein
MPRPHADVEVVDSRLEGSITIAEKRTRNRPPFLTRKRDEIELSVVVQVGRERQDSRWLGEDPVDTGEWLFERSASECRVGSPIVAASRDKAQND